MALMVTHGSELVRYNPSNGNIEYSNNHGVNWYCRCSGSSIGNVRCLIDYGSELLCCSDRGVSYSNNGGASWYQRTTSFCNFVDMQDCGNELIAMTDDGHIYYSNNRGASWYCRR